MRRLLLAPLALLLLAGCGGGSPSADPVTVTVTHSPKSTGPTTFSASGYIDVEGQSFYAVGGEKVCTTSGGYDDIRTGAQVAVSSPSGDVVAVGRLDAGAKHGFGMCRFPFTVDGIPEGLPLYSVEVSHRGSLTYSETEMKAGLAFDLG